jgi:predicted NodU family carbamoyl transferase
MRESFAQNDERELSTISKKSLREKIAVRILRHDLAWHLSCAFVVSGIRDAPLAARDSGGINAADDPN